MKKFRTLVAAALLVLPSLLVSSPGYSTAELPAIDPGASPLQQQHCPVENGVGCGGFNGLIGANPMLASIVIGADRFRRERIQSCLQFVQRLRSFGVGPV